MFHLDSELEGKEGTFGAIFSPLEKIGFHLGDNWDYDHGSFDALLWREKGESIYLRTPFDVMEGELDHFDAIIQFQRPYIIKHVVNIGLDHDGNALLTSTGLEQFQAPIDKDGRIQDKSKWEEVGQRALHKLMNTVPLVSTEQPATEEDAIAEEK
ncbi:YugN family protein [Aliibacillus thermotolerans]|uniref:YugN family protein n=1 Tax=Aliibacillus thermotolerans TaxID=1834418 RepID=A0ABW0UBC7_9BACI|nr:YugN family protein [Aliibacillus thermotolerans]MDA3130212.1 hypothetical protein [Aliibacillus thermotolerans]